MGQLIQGWRSVELLPSSMLISKDENENFKGLSLPDLVALASPEPELPTLHLDLSSDPLEVSNQPLSSTVILCHPLDLDSYPLEVSYFLLVGFPLLASDSQLM